MITMQYTFAVPDGQKEAFEESWARVTEIYLHYSNSGGSRLWNEESTGLYIAFALWPSREAYNSREEHIPADNPELEKWGKAMTDTGYTLVEKRELIDRINLWK